MKSPQRISLTWVVVLLVMLAYQTVLQAADDEKAVSLGPEGESAAEKKQEVSIEEEDIAGLAGDQESEGEEVADSSEKEDESAKEQEKTENDSEEKEVGEEKAQETKKTDSEEVAKKEEAEKETESANEGNEKKSAEVAVVESVSEEEKKRGGDSESAGGESDLSSILGSDEAKEALSEITGGASDERDESTVESSAASSDSEAPELLSSSLELEQSLEEQAQAVKDSVVDEAPEQEQAAVVGQTASEAPVRRTILEKLPPAAEIAVILVKDRFYPSQVHLKNGMRTRLIFTTTNTKAGALIIERLRVQRWISSVAEQPREESEQDLHGWEINREIADKRITYVTLNPVYGAYTFYDAISGARGEIVVEE